MSLSVSWLYPKATPCIQPLCNYQLCALLIAFCVAVLQEEPMIVSYALHSFFATQHDLQICLTTPYR